MNTLPKHVASTTLKGPLEWDNAPLLPAEVPAGVQARKAEDGGDLHVVGGTRLVTTLLEHNLVDGFRLVIDPLVLDQGKRFLSGDGGKRPLQLTESKVTSTGAILADYALASA